MQLGNLPDRIGLEMVFDPLRLGESDCPSTMQPDASRYDLVGLPLTSMGAYVLTECIGSHWRNGWKGKIGHHVVGTPWCLPHCAWLVRGPDWEGSGCRGARYGPQSLNPTANSSRTAQFRKAVRIQYRNWSFGNAARRDVRFCSVRLGHAKCRLVRIGIFLTSNSHRTRLVGNLSESVRKTWSWSDSDGENAVRRPS